MNKAMKVAPKRGLDSGLTETQVADKGNSSALRLAYPCAMRTQGLYKSFGKSKVNVPVLKGVDLEIPTGQFTAIVGKSGSGKSTLLHLLGTLDEPDAGEIWFRDERIDSLPHKRRDALRNKEFGLIFQFYHLLPELTVLENVLVPKMVESGFFSYMRNKSKFKKRAKDLLTMVGMEHRLKHRPSQLSGGEMQRTAIARALISDPSVLLADEPTGNLDGQNGEEVMKTLTELAQQDNLTIVMVTHDDRIADAADHLIHLVDGVVA